MRSTARVALLAALTGCAAARPETRGEGMATITEPGPLDVVLTRVFEVPVAQVWRAWTDGEQVKRWWGPRGFTAPVARMDVREGGRSLVCMRAPAEYGGQDMYNTWTYRKVVPNELLEFMMHFSDPQGTRMDPAKMGLPPGIPDGVPHVVTFKALAPNRTELKVIEYGYTAPEARDLSKSGLQECLDKMAESFTPASG
jgi:uncharacterized protein YndB with AHSA1/START domain